jgi:hypothetical protein
MFIRGIGVELYHVSTGVPGESDKAQVCLPRDPGVWSAVLQQAIEDHGYLQISIATTFARGAVAFAVGQPEDVEDPLGALQRGSAFGFIANLATLRQLRGAIDAAIAAVDA